MRSLTRRPDRKQAALSYRIARTVLRAVWYETAGDCYPLCPRCARELEREYVRFCDRCGQRLDWGTYEKVLMIHWKRP